MMILKQKARSPVVALIMSTLLAASVATAAEEDKSERSREELQQKLEAAQKRLDVAAREVADLSMSLSEDVMPPDVMMFRGMHEQSAVLGLNIGSGRNDHREDGVEILSVSPGGGAAEAGLKAGDVLTEMNGKSLKKAGDESPRVQLLTAMHDVQPGENVTLKYLRDGKSATAVVTAREAPERTFQFRVPGPGSVPPLPPLPNFAFMRADGVFGSAELVPMTPKLGQYFGSDKGLLVVRAPGDARLKLEEGDVIVDIDGRVPSNPSHALQILGSYQAGEKLKLNVLRMKKRITFDITIPQDANVDRPGMHSSRMILQPPVGVGVPVPVQPPLPPLEAGKRVIVTAPGPDQPI